MDVYSMVIESNRFLEIDENGVRENAENGEVLLRYKNKMFAKTDVPSILIFYFPKVYDRDSMYNEFTNLGVPCLRIEEVISLNETWDSIVKNSEKYKKRMGRIAKRKGLL